MKPYSKCRQLQSLAFLSHGGPGNQAWDLSDEHQRAVFFLLCLCSWSLKFSVLFWLPPRRGGLLCSWYYVFFHHISHSSCAFIRMPCLFAVPRAYLVLQQHFVSPTCSYTHCLLLWCSRVMCHDSIMKCSYTILLYLYLDSRLTISWLVHF